MGKKSMKKSLIKLGELDEGLEMKATIPEWLLVLVYNIQQDGHFSKRNY